MTYIYSVRIFVNHNIGLILRNNAFENSRVDAFVFVIGKYKEIRSINE